MRSRSSPFICLFHAVSQLQEHVAFIEELCCGDLWDLFGASQRTPMAQLNDLCLNAMPAMQPEVDCYSSVQSGATEHETHVMVSWPHFAYTVMSLWSDMVKRDGAQWLLDKPLLA